MLSCLARIFRSPAAAQFIATALEIYVTGSLNVFNHRTNVDIDNRIVCYDIKELGKQLKQLGMLVIQDQVWNRVTVNRAAGKTTRYYVAVNHRFLHRLEAVFTAHNNVAEGQQEVHLQRQRAFIIRIVQVEVHRIDILLAGGGNLYHLSVQPLDKGVILGLRVCNQNVIVRDEEHIQNLPLGGEGFAAPGGSED